MNKITIKTVILNKEVKNQSDFDLLVTVTKATGMILKEQDNYSFNIYTANYLIFNDSEFYINHTNYLDSNKNLITFNEAIFSKAKFEWTHIWQSKITKDFFYGNSKRIYFNITSNEKDFFKFTDRHTLVTTRDTKSKTTELLEDELKVSDVIERIHDKNKFTILYIDKVSAVLEPLNKSLDRSFLTVFALKKYYKKIVSTKENLANFLRTDVLNEYKGCFYTLPMADKILNRFDVVEKN